MKAKELLNAVSRKLGTESQTELAAALGVTVQTLNNWRNKNTKLQAPLVANAIAKSRNAAVAEAQYQTIQPLAEFYPIEKYQSKSRKSWQLFPTGEGATIYANGLRTALGTAKGIYIFYDSRGHALYVGKAKEQNLWKEMNLTFNRPREVQKIYLVGHPARNQKFKPGYEKLRQPKQTQLKLWGLAQYFSAYQVIAGMIDDLETLLVRGFANDISNVKMETFQHARR